MSPREAPQVQPQTPADQSQANAPAATTDQQQQPLNVTSIEEITDPDEIELRDAQAAAKAEETAAQAPGTDQPSGTVPQPISASATGQQQPSATPSPKVAMIPKPRVDELISQRDRHAQDAAYWRGVAEARAPVAGQPANAQQPNATAQTPEQRLRAVHTEIDALAARFDAGEISYADLKKAERELQTKEQGIREEALLAKVPQPRAQDGGGDALYLDDVTTQLLGQHPWVNVFDQVGTPKDWAYLEATARDRIVERGAELPSGALGSAMLRREMAATADELGPVLLTARAQAKGLTLPGHQPQAPGTQQQPQKPPLSPTAQNRLTKLEQQSNAPPALARMSGASGVGEVPESSIEHMSDDEIAALPPATRSRILGRTA